MSLTMQGLLAALLLAVTAAAAGQSASSHGTDASPQAVPHEGPGHPHHKMKRCSGTLGSWCGPYFHQEPVPHKPAPIHGKRCPGMCSGVGVCHADTGLCDCPAGWGGPDCATPRKRPCTNSYRRSDRSSPIPSSHIDPVTKRDLNWTQPGFTYSRCAGICDDDIGVCYCDGPKHGRVPAPPGSHPGTPPIKQGRLLFDPCHRLTDDGNGTQLQWFGPGGTPWSKVYGPEGWCMVDEPATQCGCTLDGTAGRVCEVSTEMFCPNQCSGRGECKLGFCACHQGWYGLDCAKRASWAPKAGGGSHNAAGDVVEPSPLTQQRPWLKDYAVDVLYVQQQAAAQAAAAVQAAATQPAAHAVQQQQQQQQLRHSRAMTIESQHAEGDYYDYADSANSSVPADTTAAAQATSSPRRRRYRRRRPLIYVYDTPSTFVSDMLQYRMLKDSCTWRVWDKDNNTHPSDWTYMLEPHLHELMLQSPHRTLDPEEADFFYVPVYASCYFHPVHGWADYPWFYSDSWSRVKGASVMYRDTLTWLKTAYPYWNRTAGADHIWLFTHDEGACWAPREVYQNSIILAHWGRMDPWPHISGTTYGPDNYTSDVLDDPFLPGGFRQYTDGHPCYTPGKDLVMPMYKNPQFYARSPYMGAHQPKRDILLFHRGRGMGKEGVKHNAPAYSRGVRQRAYTASVAGGWREKYNVWMGDGADVPGDGGELMARSVFCLVAAGDGWSSRFDSAVQHGCLPVVAIDNVHGPYESILRWKSFSVRVAEADVETLPTILQAIPAQQVERMQHALARVWHKMVWLTHPHVRQTARSIIAGNKGAMSPEQRAAREALPWLQTLAEEQMQDDAFSTLMQWLYFKLLERGKKSQQREEGASNDASGSSVTTTAAAPAAGIPAGDATAASVVSTARQITPAGALPTEQRLAVLEHSVARLQADLAGLKGQQSSRQWWWG